MEAIPISASPFPFLHLVEQLKQTVRRGWEIRGIASPESVSDHMYRMTVMIMMAPGVDNETRIHAMKMALVHDLGEALVGDIAPSDGVSKEDKHLRERLAFQYLSCLAKPVNLVFAEEITALWCEFEEGITDAARLVRSIDALECMTQAVEYEERSRRQADLKEFMGLESRVTVPALKEWVEHLKQDREDVWSRERADILVLFVLGGPGVGKGTQCAKLAQDFDGVHISVGDLLREEAKSDTSVAEFINDSIRNSVIIPAHLTIRLLRKKMEEAQAQGTRVFVIDGFPRSLDQVHAFEEKIHASNSTVLLKCSEATMLDRLGERAKTSNRIDDNPESVLMRLRTFSKENSKVEKHLQQTGGFFEIEAMGSVERVYSDVRAVVKKLV